MNKSVSKQEKLAIALKDETESKLLRNTLTKKKFKIEISQQLFTLSLLEYVCNFLNPKDQTSAQKKFREICDKLVNFNVIGPNLISDNFRPIRFQYQKLLYAIFNQTSTIYPQLSIKNEPENSNSGSKLIRQSSANENENSIFSRYASDFIELGKLASGGFGSVYKARNILDENIYAIKKIILRNYSPDLLKKVWSEVRLFSGLNHENIVNYHSSWIEFDVIIKDNKRNCELEIKELSNTSLSSNTSEHSHSDMQIVFQDNSKEDLSQNSKSKLVEKKSHEKSYDEKQVSVSNSCSNAQGFFRSAKSISNFDSRTDWTNENDDDSKLNTEHSVSTTGKKRSLIKRSLSENIVILYIQMRLCDLTLKDWLHTRNEEIFNSGKMIDEKINLDLYRQILSGIDYLHKKSIIHRDIKPGNIFILKENMQIKIGDFGLACLESTNETNRFSYASSTESPSIETRTRGVGTPIYASPEQLKGDNYDSKSDMYSLGIILFELYHPFRTKMERYIEIENVKKFVFSNEMTKNWTKQCDIIRNLLDENPKKRPNAFSLLVSELFLSKDQIILDLYRILEIKDRELREKDEIIAKKEEMIQKLLRSI